MKKHILPLIACALLFSACGDFLDRNSYQQVSQEIFWKEKLHFEMALAGNYTLLQRPTSAGDQDTRYIAASQPGFDCLTDNCYGKNNYGRSKELVEGNISPATTGYISVIYDGSFKGITRANLFLRELANYTGDDMTQAEKNIMEGEVRFLRAYHYFYLYMFYGDVPLVLEPLTIEEMKQPKVPASEILAQIIADLDFGIANLKDVPYYQNVGHICKTTAQAFKARVLIFAAYGNTGVPDANILRQVRDLCSAIRPQYTLSPDFQHLFLSQRQNSTQEIIFAVNFLYPNGIGEQQINTLQTSYACWNPLQSFVDVFECIDGLPIDQSPLYDPEHPFENRDIRLKRTIYKDIVVWDDGTTYNPTEDRITGYGVIKYCDQRTYTTATNPNPPANDADIIQLRLAEVLLNYAEAQNELEGPDATVYELINEIRNRAGLPNLPTGLSKEQMREKIRHERRVELAFENGSRLFDLKRWRIMGEIYSKVTDGILTYRWEDRFYKWPLPLQEVERNTGILEQNPDYR